MLPKPGKWMTLFKEFLGFPMLISAGWLLLIYIELEGSKSFFPIIFALILVTLFFWYKKNLSKPKKSRINFITHSTVIQALLLVAIMIVVYTIFSTQAHRTFGTMTNVDIKTGKTNISKETIKWRNWEKGLAEESSQKGETVFLDFTAKWCITCQVNKIRILEDKQVINLFSDKNITLIRADWTRQNKEIEDEIRKYGRIGVPLNILLRPGKPPYVFSEWLNKDELISLIGD